METRWLLECLHVCEDDIAMYATLLQAVTKRLPFDVIYDTEKRDPWGDPYSCLLTSVTIKR
jgi:hypothetical protein